jgi:hypothetical protein
MYGKLSQFEFTRAKENPLEIIPKKLPKNSCGTPREGKLLRNAGIYYIKQIRCKNDHRNALPRLFFKNGFGMSSY